MKGLNHRVEPCVEGDVMIIEEPVNFEENDNPVEVEPPITGHSGHEDLNEYGVSKSQINALDLEAARDSIDDFNPKVGGLGECSRECNPNLIVSEGRNSTELDLVAAQIVADVEIINEEKRMVEARNRIKDKAKAVLEKSKDKEKLIEEAAQMVISSCGQLVLKDNLQVVDIDEAVRRMDEATEHQIKAGSLLGFTINLKEPERKKR